MPEVLLEAAPPQAPRYVGPVDFRIYTAGLELVEVAEDQPIVRAVGSSTIQDLQGDIMELSALQAMTHAPPGLLIFLNHSYNAPEDLGGQLVKAPDIRMSGKFVDLWLTLLLFTRRNPRIRETYAYIQDGVQMGTSIGCLVKDYTIEDDGARLHILDVEPMEWSLTPLPANQRCWVEHAAKGIFARTYDERLAPIVKQLFPTDFRDLTKKLPDKDHQEHLMNIPARTATARRLFWYPTRRGFALSPAVKEATELLSRAAVEALFTDAAPQATPRLPGEGHEDRPPGSTQPIPPITVNVTVQTAETQKSRSLPAVQKTVCGNLDWPFAAKETEWVGTRARDEIEAWAKQDDGTYDGKKLKSVCLWVDGDETLLGSYKLDYCYILDGTPHIVPKRVPLLAGALDGAHGGLKDIPEDDIVRLKGKVSILYRRLRAEVYENDPDVVPPWEKKEKQEMFRPAAKTALPIAADGTHPAPEEDIEHSHPHPAYGSQGSDGSHEHMHPHKAGHASHDHPASHDTAKGLLDPSAGGRDAAHAGSEPAPARRSPAPTRDTGLSDTERESLIRLIDYAAEKLGLPNCMQLTALAARAQTPAVKANDFQSNWQATQAAEGIYEDWWQMTDCLQRTLRGILGDVSIEDKQSACLASLTQFCTACLAWCLRADSAGIYADDETAHALYGIEVLTHKMLKAGREFSSENQARFQVLHDKQHEAHDHLMETVPGLKCLSLAPQAGPAEGSLSVDDAERQANMEAGRQVSASLQPVLAKLEAIGADFKAWDLEALRTELLATKAEALSAKAESQDALGKAATIHQGLDRASRAISELYQEVERLAHVRLPRPTQLNRSIANDPTAATYREMLAAGQSQPSADSTGHLMQTSLEEVEGRGLCRRWPAGVGGKVVSKGGQRPELTQQQLAHMSGIETTLYDTGAEVLVPEFPTFN